MMTMKSATLSTIQMSTVLRRKSQSDRPPEAQTIKTKQPRLPFIPILLHAHPVLSEQKENRDTKTTEVRTGEERNHDYH